MRENAWPTSTEATWREAVQVVDTRHGYTVESAPCPDQHRAEYDAEYRRLRVARRRKEPQP